MRAVAGAIIVLAGAVAFAAAFAAHSERDAVTPGVLGAAYTFIGLLLIVTDYASGGRSKP
jgi:uncharacterized membrane protein HdeD (DUF308 family)